MGERLRSTRVRSGTGPTGSGEGEGDRRNPQERPEPAEDPEAPPGEQGDRDRGKRRDRRHAAPGPEQPLRVLHGFRQLRELELSELPAQADPVTDLRAVEFNPT